MSTHRSRMTRPLALASTAVLALGGVLLTASPAAAVVDSYTVHNLSGDGTVVDSLPWAVLQAEGDSDATTIDFEPGLTGPIPLIDSLFITHDLTINGPGSNVITVEGPPSALNVFDISNSGTAPVVAINGLTVSSPLGGNPHGIYSDDGDLTLLDIIADGFGDSAVYVTHAGLEATLVEASSNGNDGITFIGDSGDDLTLDRITADGNSFSGVVAQVADATALLTTVGVNGNPTAGVDLSLDASTLTASSITSVGNDEGIRIDVTNGSTAQIAGSSVTDSTFAGITYHNSDSQLDIGTTLLDNNVVGIDIIGGVGAEGTSRTTFTALTVTDNIEGGVYLGADTGATIQIDASTIEHNGDTSGCGCGFGGVLIGADAAALSITGSSILDNTSEVGAGVSVVSLTGGSTLDITGSTISGNHAESTSGDGTGGGLAVGDLFGFGPGLADDGTTIRVTDTTISGNDAELGGGGVALVNLGTGVHTGGVQFLRTTIDGNAVNPLGGGCGCGPFGGGGLFVLGAAPNYLGDPVVSLEASTVSHNTIDGDGAGIYLAQVPGEPGLAAIAVLNSTIAGNTATGDGSAVFIEAGLADPGTFATLFRHSTIAGNVNTSGGIGGVYVDAVEVALDLESTIIAGNDNGDLFFDSSIAAFTALFDLVQDPSGAGIPLLTTDGNILGVDPQLATLAFNGGTTQTMLLAPGSPAYNAGNPGFVAPPTTDQRGQARVYQRIDIGAVEWHPALALTGGAPSPQVPLWGMLFLFIGLALVAASRIRQPI
ncbi:MAG: polymorphic outer membrane protein [Rhodoglobus sp.]|nr:polymorphic outer membrane protein [Rhodoglobus sp.]